MKSSRAICALTVAGVVLVVATTASAGWRGLADLNYDDEGRICSNAMEFSLASSLGPARISVSVTDITADPEVEIVPLTQLPDLTFAPVPELFDVATYLHSRTFRLHFSPRPAPGSELRIEFSGGEGIDGATVDVVDRCWLFTQFELKDSLEPPAVTVPENPELVRIPFHLPLVGGQDVFTEGPAFAPIPCQAPASATFQEPTPAEGELRRWFGGFYVFRWHPPAGLTGCHELSFRTVELGLSDEDLGLNHRVLFDFGSDPTPG